MQLSEQIIKIKSRLKDKPDPLLHEVLKSLEKLDKLNTVEGLIEFHKREFCSPDEAAEYLECSGTSARKKIQSYFKSLENPSSGRSHRIEIPAIAINEGKKKPNYVVIRRGLKPLKQQQ